MKLQGMLRYCLFAALLLLTSCHSLLNFYYADTLPPQQGQITLSELKAPVNVRYNILGIPLISVQNLNVFGLKPTELCFLVLFPNLVHRRYRRTAA